VRRSVEGFRGLLAAATLVRDERDLALALERIGDVIAATLGFSVVVTNLYRRAWDDFIVGTVHGDPEIRRQLLDCTYERVFFEQPMRPEFDHGGAYLIPEGAFDWDAHPGERVVPDMVPSSDDDAWRPGDEIFVPFHSSTGELLGIYNVGLPESGRRPGEEQLASLVAVIGQAGTAVEAAQAAADASRQRRALEHLLRISSGLTNISTTEPSLQLVVDGIHDALGFLKVCIYTLRDESSLVPSAFAGWPADSLATRHVFPARELERLFQPTWATAGCYLIPNETARAIVSTSHHIYRSEMNGRGEHAWDSHWLLVPLYGRDGDLTAVIWADDPADRLLPGRETLQALRMFANHAAAAIEASKDVAALRDLSATNARLLQQEREQVAQLRELDRLKDEFVALVSHELRTPLTSIQGYTELLHDEIEDATHRSYLETIQRSADRLLAVVSELLLIAQLQAGKLALDNAPLELDLLLRDAVEQGRVAAEAKNIRIEIDVADDRLTVLGDRTRLGQVIDNLVSNAIKFTLADGRVDVRATRDGGTVGVEVADTGIGIPLDEQAQMFSRFFRTTTARDANIPGTGLGLAITKGLVDAHGGRISFRSKPGSGTTFRVELPLAQMSTERVPSPRYDLVVDRGGLGSKAE